MTEDANEGFPRSSAPQQTSSARGSRIRWSQVAATAVLATLIGSCATYFVGYSMGWNDRTVQNAMSSVMDVHFANVRPAGGGEWYAEEGWVYFEIDEAYAADAGLICESLYREVRWRLPDWFPAIGVVVRTPGTTVRCGPGASLYWWD